MHIYIVDNPIMPDYRIKIINKIMYSCGRKPLIQYAALNYTGTYVYTGPKNELHEILINKYIDNSIIGIIPAFENIMRDFSGFQVAILDAIRLNKTDVILCNSSCPELGLKSLASLKLESFDNSIIGIGAKSFYRKDTFNIKFNPHLQSYALRLIGENTLFGFYKYILFVQNKFNNLDHMSEIDFKRYLIQFCEIGFNNYCKENGKNRYFLTDTGELIKVPNYPSLNFPFMDSRKKDQRFK